jgi:glycosyltransferase involved in cell wall biosynthesis
VLPLPILTTNSANKFYDYLAAGLVVGLNYGGWQAELIEKEGCGFSAASPEAFAEQVLFYYGHRQAWRAAAMRARALAERLFDRRKLAQDLIQQLRAALPPDKLPL